MAEKIRTMPVDQHPVGSIYQSVLPTDPSELFGGTWQMLKDVFLMAAGDKYAAGSTGGEAQHTLTVEEMPAHGHNFDNYFNGYANSVSETDKFMTPLINKTNPDDTVGIGVWTNPTGGSKPHNNLPPYLTVYTWVRVA